VARRGPEAKVVDKLVRQIETCGVPAQCRIVYATMHASGGEPDIDACVGGVTLKVEAKAPGQKPTPRQLSVMRKWARAGAVVGWADSVEALQPLLDRAVRRSMLPALVTAALESGSWPPELSEALDAWTDVPTDWV
jgi:hypothetical protein